MRLTRKALRNSVKWPVGTVITLKFLDFPSTKLRDKVLKYGTIWTNFANIKFSVVKDTEPAQVRISFKGKGEL